MRVLVAEDERITRATLTRQLEKWGHEVVATENGREAWERFEAERFDILLTDWEMPEVSGPELVERVRRLERPEYTYVILLTSRSDKCDIVSGLEAGADDFVSKPFDREELRVRLLAGERIVTLERRLSARNEELRAAGARMSRDLEAAARVQRAMLPKEGIESGRVRASFVYEPTDELAGDALGFHLIEDRFLTAYVVDVTGHGVPAALLAVTAMHALSPGDGGALVINAHSAPSPAKAVDALNRRFCAGDNDGRFLTMILCVLDLHTGRLTFARAGHPLPVLIRDGQVVELDDEGGMPVGILEESGYVDVHLDLAPGDRVLLYSDGIPEQMDSTETRQFGEQRLTSLFVESCGRTGDDVVSETIDSLSAWAGSKRFKDDVSLLVLDWIGE